jgi:hypothetical protein
MAPPGRDEEADVAISTESVRWGLLQAVEAAYYTGPTAGQPWLPQVSVFLDALPRTDPRLARLAVLGASNALRDFIAASPPAVTDRFEPAGWLDRYIGWAGR